MGVKILPPSALISAGAMFSVAAANAELVSTEPLLLKDRLGFYEPVVTEFYPLSNTQSGFHVPFCFKTPC